MSEFSQIFLDLPWEAFVAHWCLGTPPASEPEEVARAFDALQRLWPDRLAALRTKGDRGVPVVAPAIHDGSVLAACESLRGFPEVLARIVLPERSAFMEATVAAALVRLGYQPLFGPELAGKRPDLAIEVFDQTIYLEIVSVQRSELTQEAARTAQAIANRLAGQCHGESVELYLGPHWTDTDSERVIAAVANASARAEPVDLNGDAHVIKELALQENDAPALTLRIPKPDDVRAASACVTDRTNGQWSTAIVRRAVSDERAATILSKELHHLNKAKANIVIVDASGVPGGIASWEPLLRRTLQPTRNTRVGAIVIIDQALAGQPLQTKLEWSVLPNPYAACPVPPGLLASLQGLHEPHS